jgi:hypothetical protein
MPDNAEALLARIERRVLANPNPTGAPIPDEKMAWYQRQYDAWQDALALGELAGDSHALKYPQGWLDGGLNVVAAITDNNVAWDGFLWVPTGRQHTSIRDEEDLRRILSLDRYAAGALDLLLISGHGNDNRGVNTQGGEINVGTMDAATVELIRRKVKATGAVVLTSCGTGDDEDRVQEFADVLMRTVAAAKDVCRGLWETGKEWGFGGYAEGGYAVKRPRR